MSEEMSPEMVAEARRLANEVWEKLVVPHEREEHDGEPCLSNRVGTVAYFAHVIGVRSIHADMFGEILLDYEEIHDHREHGNGRP